MTKEEFSKLIPKYIDSWKKYLVDTWGLESDFAKKLANVILWCAYFGFQADITSGYRSVADQKRIIEEYKAGSPYVITPLPAGKSLHQGTNWFGSPASLACDIVFRNDNRNNNAGFISQQLGVVWAGEPDFVHFAARRGTL